MISLLQHFKTAGSWFVLVCFSSIFVNASAADAIPAAIKPEEAARHLGKEVSITFKVAALGHNDAGDYLELYSTTPFDAPGNLCIRLSPAIRKQFTSRGVSDFSTHFTGRSIHVIGRVDELNFGTLRVPVIYLQSSAHLSSPENVAPPVLPAPAPASEYKLQQKDYRRLAVGKISLFFSPEIAKADPALGRQLEDMLLAKAREIQTLLPAASYERFDQITVITNMKGPLPGGAYHPAMGYLQANGMPDYYLQAIEFRRAREILDLMRTHQPYALLHDIAHKYHMEVLGEKDREIIAAFEAAVASGKYDKVKHAGGTEVRAYASTNHGEYFAELTEAYFGKNDFYPFVRSELQSHDPQGYAMIESRWKVKNKK